MHIGVVYPQTEYGNDTIAIRDFAQMAEGLGYSHIIAYDHVLGANPDRPGGWRGTYTYQDAFHEPFVLFAYMAAYTQRIQFTSSIIILPQRQTALVAKQAATVDILSGGRLRLGIGLGWNPVEYVALNEDFHTRGRRIEEQIVLLKRLWTEPLVEFSGKWHQIPDAGLNPLPIQRPIPIWMGGHADAVLRRAARHADGWMPNYKAASDAQPALERLNQFLDEEGRNRADFGIEVRLHYADGDARAWQQAMAEWRAGGTTHFSINLMRSGLSSPQDFQTALERFAQAMGLAQSG